MQPHTESRKPTWREHLKLYIYEKLKTGEDLYLNSQV